jgi:hypothetical protein
MVKQLIIVAALALTATAARAQPTEADIEKYQAKLAEYVARGTEPDDIALGLRGWFGWPFLTRRDYGKDTIEFIVKAPVNGEEIRYYRVIGSITAGKPYTLLREEWDSK